MESNENPQADDNVISLDDIDSILKEEVPNLENEMGEISEAGKDLNPEDVAADQEIGDKLPDEEEKKSSKFFDKIRKNKKIQKVLRILSVLTRPFQIVLAILNRRWIRLRNFVIIKSQQFISYIKNDFPKQLRLWQRNSTDFVKYWISRLKDLKKLSRFKKFLLFLAVTGLIVLVTLFKMNMGGRWIPDFSESLLKSFEPKADEVIQFSEKEDLVNFYDSFPQPDHTVLLKNVVVNLRRVRGSQSPFASAELFINLDSKDTAIEVKQREREFLDYVQRELEEYSYEELNSIKDLNRAKEDIKNTLNRYINRGRVKNIYFKTLITHP